MADAATRTRMSFETNRRRLESEIAANLLRAIRMATEFMANQAQQSLSTGQPTTTFGRYTWGLSPSFPGQPPKRVRGELQRSIVTEIVQPSRTRVIGRAGTTERKAKSLEYGATIPLRRARRNVLVFPVRQRAGRRTAFRQAPGNIIFRRYARGFTLRPRPWLKPLVNRHRQTIINFIRANL